jgi:2'-5' RNA ligase
VSWFVGAPASFPGPEPLVPDGSGLSPTRTADRHVTLVFLGAPPEEDVVAYWRSLPELRLPVSAQVEGLARFGRGAIVVTLADDGGRLAAAAEACYDAAPDALGLRRPEAHRPHVTLARVARRATPPSARTLQRWPVPPGPVALGPVTLFRSRPAGPGDRYERVAHQPPVPPSP